MCLHQSILPQTNPATSLPDWLGAFLKKPAEVRGFRIRNASGRYKKLRLSDPNSSRYTLEIIFVYLPPGSFRFHVQDIRQKGALGTLMEKASVGRNLLVVTNGGFLGTHKGIPYPMGLVVSAGERLNDAWTVDRGGILFSTTDGHIKIKPRRDLASVLSMTDVQEALQSEPLLVENFRSGIHSETHELANRIAVATRADDSIVIAAALSDNGQALSLNEFAEVLRAPESLGGGGVMDAINLDGGPSVHIYIPALALHIGGIASTYATNFLEFIAHP